MDNNPFVKGLKNASIGVKRAVERMSIDVMGGVGLSGSSLPESHAQYDHLSSAYAAQTDALKLLRSDAVSAFDAIARSTATAHALAARLNDALPATPSGDSAQLAADALLSAQAFVADDVLSRVERRVKKRVIDPADEELEVARDVAARVQFRKKVLLDAQRYRSRVSDSSLGGEDERKAREKAEELSRVTDELIAVMSAAIPRRAAFVERAVAETVEFQRRFYLDSARALERAVEAVGMDRLASLRGSAEDQDTARANNPGVSADFDDEFSNPSRQPRRPTQIPRQSSPQPQRQPSPQPPRRSNGTSLWDEDDDDHTVDHDPRPKRENPFDGDIEFASSFEQPSRQRAYQTPTSSTIYTSGARESQSSYPSGGIGKRESVGGYPTGGVGARESPGSSYPSGGIGVRESASSAYGVRESTASSYPSGGSRQRENVYPTKSASRSKPPPAAAANAAASKPSGKDGSTATKPGRRNRTDTEDLLNFDEPEPTPARAPSRSRKPTPAPAPAPASSGVEDLLDLGSSTRREAGKSSSTSAMEGDLLGDFASAPPPIPSRSRSSNQTRSRNPSPSVASSSSAPSMGGPAPTRSNVSGSMAAGGVNLEREQLRKKHEAEIKARADEKLAAVRERERAEEKERDQKDSARGAAEAKVNQWTGNGTRRGNLRALLASLDTVLYPGATWKAVSMDTLKANAKVKVNYHKAILQVHPDKIGPKNLPIDQQVLAELIFDELKNGYEVWTAEQEGRPPPPGSVGPKNAPKAGGFGGMGGMSNMARGGMYSNMGGMGRGGMGMGGMGRNPMGGMGGMGMGSMGRGMGGMGAGMGAGMGGMGGRGMGGMGMGGMGSGYGGAQQGRRGTGMGNMPQGYGRGGQTRR